jgi:hypothetical protein
MVASVAGQLHMQEELRGLQAGWPPLFSDDELEVTDPVGLGPLEGGADRQGGARET